MRIKFLFMFFIWAIFAGHAMAMSPKKTNIPKDQPGYSELDKARQKGGKGMSREYAEEVRKKYSKIPISEVTQEDTKIINEARKVLNEKMGYSCCGPSRRCQGGTGNCFEISDRSGRRTCDGFATRC